MFLPAGGGEKHNGYLTKINALKKFEGKVVLDLSSLIDLSLIEEAARIITPICRKTEIIPAIFSGSHPSFYIKPENLQTTGSFKMRGAYYAMSKLGSDSRERGVLAASAGNHAQGVAMAAREMGIPCTIVMPRSAPLSKVTATKGYGAEVILEGDTYNDAYIHALSVQKERELVYIHPFNNADVITGQGTVGLEIIESMPDVQNVVIPVGGGGLASGMAVAIKEKKPSCRVFGVQAANAASMFASLQSGQITTLKSVATIADGIAVSAPGDLTFDLCARYLDGVFTVTEEEISGAILTMLERMKLVSEGAGAAAVAALLFGRLTLPGNKTVAVVSGGNIDVNLLSRIIDAGLKKTGRKVVLLTEIVDKPGMLGKLLNSVAATGANLVSAHHDRIAHNVQLGHCVVELTLETFSADHIESICRELTELGYSVNVAA